MSSRSKYLMIAASLILLGVFMFPIWNINLKAPQYPEGIGLRIWVNQVTGEKEFDLKNINGLNHYIGMKAIEPDTISELKYMPFILVFFIGTGLIISFIKNKKMIFVWILLFLVVMSIGLYDFYLWGYDYGHNLDPTAPIKVPGMSYQPPVIGTKKLLNITATSLPGIGSILILISLSLAAISYFTLKKDKGELNV
jgi:copper chaperone NosL